MNHLHNTVNINFTKREDDKWILEHSNKYFIISESIKDLIQTLERNNYDLKSSYTDFLKNYEFLEQNQFNTLVEENIKNLELDENSISNPIKEKSFILFERQIFSPIHAGKIANYFTFLYQPFFFWITFSILTIFTIYQLGNMHHLHVTNNYLFLLIGFYLISSILHEIGHIAACKRFTDTNGEIGLGIYFIFPVFYSNITPIWKANKQERIITNLAGVYIQLLLLAIIYIINLFFSIHEINDLISLSIVIILYQLIPFIRTDGYWIVTDLFNSPNLLPNSSLQTKKLIKQPLNWKQFNTKKEVLELVYGIFNFFAMIYILGNIIFNYQLKLITVPYQLIVILITDFSSTLNFLKKNIEVIFIAIIFYLISFNFIKNTITKKASSN